MESFLQAARQHDTENRSGLSGAFHNNLAAMILNDFLHYRQSQPRAVFLPVTDERMEQAVLD
jgi:hypothetical protein